MTISAFMCEDHERLYRLFRQFQMTKNVDLGKAKQFFSAFHQGLQRHIVWEEEILFPLLEEHTGVRDGGPTAVMRAEHRSFKAMLDLIHDHLVEGRTDSDAHEAELVSALANHNKKEEIVLYPWIDQCLSTEQIDATLASMQALPAERFEGCCK